MGHQRLGKLPASKFLPDIVRYLVTGGTPTLDLVDEITEFGQEALKHALKDPVFIEALWLLVRIPQAAESKDFTDKLRALGLPVCAEPSLSGILVAYDAAMEQVQRQSNANATDLGEMARQAALTALGDAAREHLPGLWNPALEDVRASVAAMRSTDRFSAMAQRFYSSFLERVIHYFIDRDLHHMVGPDRMARSVHDLRMFDDALARHCNEAALIMRAFASDWLGKNLYRQGKAIGREDIRSFAGYTGKKIGVELVRRKEFSETVAD